MSKFVVGYVSFFENEVELSVVEADNEVDALLQIVLCDECFTIEDIKQFAFNCDSAVSVLRID